MSISKTLLEALYIANDLPDMKLKTVNDLWMIHKVDVQKIKGYSGLTEANR